MKITPITRTDFLKLVYDARDEFMQRIHLPEAFVVKKFYPTERILAYRQEAFALGASSEPSWHPLHDDCPDYHRLHDNYEKAYVKGRIHTFYSHAYYPKNRAKFEFFREIFEIKNFLAGKPRDTHLNNKPSDGIVARVNVHHYPRGGGYQAEHIDPHGQHALVQTIVIASTYGSDYRQGGIYVNMENDDRSPYRLDPHAEVGDLLVLSPAVRHGVASIDPDESLDWGDPRGRWIILPLFVWSDYSHPENVKPRQVATL